MTALLGETGVCDSGVCCHPADDLAVPTGMGKVVIDKVVFIIKSLEVGEMDDQCYSCSSALLVIVDLSMSYGQGYNTPGINPQSASMARSKILLSDRSSLKRLYWKPITSGKSTTDYH